MLAGVELRDPLLINSVGHTAAILLFGLFLLLLIRDGRTHGIGPMRLTLAAGSLALIWNLASLIAMPLNQAEETGGLLMTAAFSALSLLPAVLLHVVLRDRYRVAVLAGYGASISAVCLLALGDQRAALAVIEIGFAALTIGVFIAQLRRGEACDRVALICLLVFTTSFLHFGYHHISAPWAAEITWHHIGIPLVLIVLLQDYRLLLLDTFIRFLANLGLAALYIAGLLAANERFGLWHAVRGNSFRLGPSLVLLCVSFILFAYVRNALQAWLDRVIFRRQSVVERTRAIAVAAAAARSEDELLEAAASEIARHLRTEHVALSGGAPYRFAVRAEIPLRFSSGDSRAILLGVRQGGRRYLSGDFDDMRRLAGIVVEQVERFRSSELKRLADQAELRALQAQINPHFLFNALNTLYGTIDRRSREARRLVLNLADIFRYCLRADRAVIQLSEELRIVEAYLEIESLRLGNRLSTELVIDESARSVLIPILSVQPLVENAVKHGIAAKSTGGCVTVRAQRLPAGLQISVEDTGLGFEHSANVGSGNGVGLANVRRRLALSHGPRAALDIRSSEAGTAVSFFLPDAPANAAGSPEPVLCAR